MQKIIFIAVVAGLAFGIVQPASACGMYIPSRGEAGRDVAPLLVRADRYKRKGRLHQAVRLYERVINNEDASVRHRFHAATAAYRIYRRLDDLDKAAGRLRVAVELRPRNQWARMELASLFQPPGPAVVIAEN